MNGRAAACGGPLLADIGGTNARFALTDAAGEPTAVRVLKCADYPDLESALRAYLTMVGEPTIDEAGMAIATPVTSDVVAMTNHPWRFSIKALQAAMGFGHLEVVNDFVALAMSIPALGSRFTRQIGTGVASAPSPKAVVGPGTGLGAGGLVASGAGQWIAIPSEGGHASFSPTDDLELRVLAYCWKHYPHVSFERLVSGPGLSLLLRALCSLRGTPEINLEAAEIVQRTRRGEDPVFLETIQLFSRLLGGFAANVALTFGSIGGMYLGGGVIDHLGDLFDEREFRGRFEAKGRYQDYLGAIPTLLVTAPYPALIGMTAILAQSRRPA